MVWSVHVSSCSLQWQDTATSTFWRTLPSHRYLPVSYSSRTVPRLTATEMLPHFWMRLFLDVGSEEVLLPGPLDLQIWHHYFFAWGRCVQEKGSRSGWFETTYHWSSWAYNTSHADNHVAKAWISFRYLSSYNRCPHWSVRTCIKIFLSYSVHYWKHKFHKAFRY